MESLHAVENGSLTKQQLVTKACTLSPRARCLHKYATKGQFQTHFHVEVRTHEGVTSARQEPRPQKFAGDMDKEAPENKFAT